MPCAFGTAGPAELLAAAEAAPSTEGRDLVSTVTTPTVVTRGTGPYRVVAYDFGIKESMLRQLGDLATVVVVPASTPADQVLGLEPDGIFLSNGPGDPAALPAIVTEIRTLAERGPCPGVRDLPRTPAPGHRPRGQHLQAPLRPSRGEPPGPAHRHRAGRDHLAEPQLRGGRGLARPSSEVTHVNLNDGVIEGIRSRDTPVFSVQYHPEAGPGPHDARYLFDEFRSLMDATGARAARAREVG